MFRAFVSLETNFLLIFIYLALQKNTFHPVYRVSIHGWKNLIPYPGLKYPIQCKSLQSQTNGIHMSILGVPPYFWHDPLYTLMWTIMKQLDVDVSPPASIISLKPPLQLCPRPFWAVSDPVLSPILGPYSSVSDPMHSCHIVPDSPSRPGLQ